MHRLWKPLSAKCHFPLCASIWTGRSWWSARPSTLWRFCWTLLGPSETAPRTTGAAAATSAAFRTGSLTPLDVWWVVVLYKWEVAAPVPNLSWQLNARLHLTLIERNCSFQTGFIFYVRQLNFMQFHFAQYSFKCLLDYRVYKKEY